MIKKPIGIWEITDDLDTGVYVLVDNGDLYFEWRGHSLSDGTSIFCEQTLTATNQTHATVLGRIKRFKFTIIKELDLR